jgi:hypothetical protein
MKIPRQVHSIARAISTAPGAVGTGVVPAMLDGFGGLRTLCPTACANNQWDTIQALGCKCNQSASSSAAALAPVPVSSALPWG